MHALYIRMWLYGALCAALMVTGAVLVVCDQAFTSLLAFGMGTFFAWAFDATAIALAAPGEP